MYGRTFLRTCREWAYSRSLLYLPRKIEVPDSHVMSVCHTVSSNVSRIRETCLDYRLLGAWMQSVARVSERCLLVQSSFDGECVVK